MSTDRRRVDAIAAAVGVSVPTLRKAYAAELAAGADAGANLFAAAGADELPSAPARPTADGRGRGGGRPSYEPDRETRQRVMEQIAVGMRDEAIALGLGISPPTFRRAFRQEIATGRDVKRAEVVSWLFRAARRGNASALTRLYDMIDRAEVAALSDAFTGAADAGKKAPAPQPAPVRPAPVGKKEQAEIEAGGVLAGGGAWADLLNGEVLPQ